MYLTGTLHIHSGKVRTRAPRAEPFRTRSIPFLLAFTLALANGICFADQTDPSAGSQSEINTAQAAYGAGNAAVKNNDWKTAEAEFEKVVRLMPQIEEGHSSLGAVLMQVGKFSQAIAELEKALALKPGDVAAQTNLALAYEQTGAYKKAVVTFEKLEAEDRQRPGSDSACRPRSGW